MRPTCLALLLAFPLLLFGCGIPPEAKRQAVLNEVAWTRFVELIDKGQTTRDQEQAFIRAEVKNAAAMRASLGLVAGQVK